MKRTLFLLILLGVSIISVAQKKVAVYVTGDDPINEIVSNRLVDGLARNGKYTAVERTGAFLNALSKEHTYERDGAVDDSEIARLGKQFSVQYVCVASVLNVWNDEKYITARIIDVETAEIVASSSSNGSIRNSNELIGALNNLTDNFLKALGNNKKTDAKKVAVYVAKTGNRDVDIILGDQLVAGFARSGRYLAIERTNSFLSQISKEQGYQQSGAVDDADLTRLGKQFGVQYVCVAKTTSWGGSYFISSRLIDVSSAEIINTYNAEGKKLDNSQSVVKIASEIAAKLTGMTIREEDEKRTEAARIQALKDESWRNRMRKVIINVNGDGNDINYVGTLANGGRLGLGLYLSDEGELYVGSHGGEKYDRDGWGLWIKKEGLPNCPRGYIYRGQFKNGLADGFGEVFDKGGEACYAGEFQQGRPLNRYPDTYNGYHEEKGNYSVSFDTITYDNGDKYIGIVDLYHQRTGLGVYIWADDTAWYGWWTEDKIDKSKNGFYMYHGGFTVKKWSDEKKLSFEY